MLEKLNDDKIINAWFGRYMTQPKYMDQLIPSEESLTPEQLEQNLANGEVINLSEGSRLAFSDTENELILFADGEGYPISSSDKSIAIQLAEQKYLTSDEINSLSNEFKVNLCELISRGSLYLSD